MFATSTDPISVFASGNVLLILAFIIVILGGVVVFLYRENRKLWVEKETLQDKRLTDITTLTDKYNVVVGNFSQTIQLLTAKLKGKR
jgi:hypothetical protein